MSVEFKKNGLVKADTFYTLSSVASIKSINSSYQALEYIQANNTGYIDLSLPLPTNATVQVNAEIGYAPNSTGRRFIFSDGNSSIAHYTEINASNQFGCNASGTGYVIYTLDADIPYHTKTVITKDSITNSLLVDNNWLSKQTSVISSGSFGKTLLLFYLLSTLKGSGQRIYHMSISINGEPVRELFPVLRKSDSYIGVYDIITNQFYGSSTLIAGTQIDSISMIDCSDIIED